MKLSEFITVVTNIRSSAHALEQAAHNSPNVMNGYRVVIFTQDNALEAAESLKRCCDQLVGLVPDIELELDDASHRNDV